MSPPVVIVTGASSGIGEALALRYAADDRARIGLLARRADLLEAVARAVRERGGEALPLPCDVTCASAVQDAVERTRGAYGPIDVAIANAGIGEPLPLRRFSADRVARTMRTNVEGPANLFAAVLPEMIERGAGRIAAVSSLAGFRGLPASGSYSASKAALTTLLESMRLELKPMGVSVTVVHPGFVRTPMTAPNRFKMPFLIEADAAARAIRRGVMRGRREVAFPWQTSLAMRLTRWLPDALYDAIMSRQAGWAPGGH